jgi:hypothetical protein
MLSSNQIAWPGTIRFILLLIGCLDQNWVTNWQTTDKLSLTFNELAAPDQM